jgi:hypothetical protein
LRLEDGFLTGIPGVSIACLISFARYCPELADLTIAFDGRSLPSTSEFQGISSEALTTLKVLYSPITDARSTAAFLSSIFPRLFAISWKAPDSYEDEICSEFERVWSQVKNELLAA